MLFRKFKELFPYSLLPTLGIISFGVTALEQKTWNAYRWTDEAILINILVVLFPSLIVLGWAQYVELKKAREQLTETLKQLKDNDSI